MGHGQRRQNILLQSHLPLLKEVRQKQHGKRQPQGLHGRKQLIQEQLEGVQKEVRRPVRLEPLRNHQGGRPDDAHLAEDHSGPVIRFPPD